MPFLQKGTAENHMLHVNENYSKIKPTYLFAEIAHRVSAHQAANPDAKIIRLGIGDVTEPLAPAVIEAMHKAVDDEAGKGAFYGINMLRINSGAYFYGYGNIHAPAYRPDDFLYKRRIFHKSRALAV